MNKRIFSLLLVFIFIFSIVGCGKSQVGETGEVSQNEVIPLEELVIGTAPGPVSYCLSYMLENQPFDMPVKAEPWNKYDQLISMATAKQVHLSGSPLTNAIMLYNKGFDIQLINVSVWGMLYVLSPDESVKEIKDLQGQEIGVAGQGGIHDLVFRHLLIQNGLDPDKDVTITYLDLPEASSKLATGELNYAVLNEPNSSMATMNAKKGGVDLFRVLDLQEEWSKVSGSEHNRIPQAGFILVGENEVTPKIVNAFNKEIVTASEWINNNPELAGTTVESYFEWMKAPAVQQSLKFARLDPKPAIECKEEVEAFFTELMKTAPAEAIGGKLPDAEFYFEP